MNIQEIEKHFRAAFSNYIVSIDRGGETLYYIDFRLGEQWTVLEIDLKFAEPFGTTPFDELCMPFSRSSVWDSDINVATERLREIMLNGGNKTWTPESE